MNQDNSISRLVLGTAQLGMNYGIANRTGAPTKEEAFQILECAWEAGVRHFDTAPGYHSGPIIGEFVRVHNLACEIQMLTKIPSMAGKNDWKHSVLQSVEKSLEELGTDTLKVVFLHAQEDVKLLSDNPEFFEDLKVRFPIESLGVSVYEPEILMETMTASNGLAFQFPYNILDRRFESVSIPKGKRYARSVFLQGLLAGRLLREDAPVPLKKLHSAISSDCGIHGISARQLSLAYAANSDAIDFFLVGVDSVWQLDDLLNLDLAMPEAIEQWTSRWRTLVDDKWLDPRKWN